MASGATILACGMSLLSVAAPDSVVGLIQVLATRHDE
jgi:hypothetical protein